MTSEQMANFLEIARLILEALTQLEVTLASVNDHIGRLAEIETAISDLADYFRR